MLAKLPPMGWNSWNTFGPNISEALIRETADAMVEKGYLAAGYTYLVIDDCWSKMERDEKGRLVPDPVKFPNGMKAVADYVHSKGLKFGMYSCAGTRTCAGYPGSFDHEYVDAQTFADWGVDFLKYDYCNFPKTANCKARYTQMSMALKATGRDILFSACNWGHEEPWKWMRAISAHMYRSTGDIHDSYVSFRDIAISQIDNLTCSAPGGFNDPDMLIVGMYGKGHAALDGCTDTEYRTHFALWCLFGVPLMIGGDIRSANAFSRDLMLHKTLIRIDQDEECRPPYLVDERLRHYFFVRHLSENQFVLGYFNLSDDSKFLTGKHGCAFSEIGIPYESGYGLDLTDVITGEHIGIKRDYFVPAVDAHSCKLYLGNLVKMNGGE